jgi:hypothetical protein
LKYAALTHSQQFFFDENNEASIRRPHLMSEQRPPGLGINMKKIFQVLFKLTINKLIIHVCELGEKTDSQFSYTRCHMLLVTLPIRVKNVARKTKHLLNGSTT